VFEGAVDDDPVEAALCQALLRIWEQLRAHRAAVAARSRGELEPTAQAPT
jgi:hypothetical protein